MSTCVEGTGKPFFGFVSVTVSSVSSHSVLSVVELLGPKKRGRTYVVGAYHVNFLREDVDRIPTKVDAIYRPATESVSYYWSQRMRLCLSINSIAAHLHYLSRIISSCKIFPDSKLCTTLMAFEFRKLAALQSHQLSSSSHSSLCCKRVQYAPEVPWIGLLWACITSIFKALSLVCCSSLINNISCVLQVCQSCIYVICCKLGSKSKHHLQR